MTSLPGLSGCRIERADRSDCRCRMTSVSTRSNTVYRSNVGENGKESTPVRIERVARQKC